MRVRQRQPIVAERNLATARKARDALCRVRTADVERAVVRYAAGTRDRAVASFNESKMSWINLEI